MIINRQNLDFIFTGFNGAFSQGFADAKPAWSTVAMRVPSSAQDEVYGWLNQIPGMREWIGPRIINSISANGYTIGNRSFENTIGVQREKIEDDKYGVFAPLMQEMGRAAAVHPDELVFSTLGAGFATECFDGQYFFDTDHPVMKDGEETSVSNMQAGSGEPWYLLDTSRAIRPLVYQERRPYNLQTKTDLSDDNVFFNKEFIYGVDGRCAAGYGLWQLAFGSKADLTPTNYSLARVAMQSLKGDGGRPLAIKPTVLVVGPANEEKALTLINSATNAAGASNPWYKTVEVIMSPWVE
ncbi:Mu-like prophage major head subunit gpT family protein [Pleomorphomonas koreensis]|uniref:Mu-like prophage major head subunit gpT family protein n=1 Tax=Pleomorphomonas koreensis TaxID=257440 RepID=UPI000426CE76|nr:Mu-like prophage major head subunit gpT family protein [Pleomorphomonas koreensis]